MDNVQVIIPYKDYQSLMEALQGLPALRRELTQLEQAFGALRLQYTELLEQFGDLRDFVKD